MSIVNDMVAGLMLERRERAAKRSLGFPEPTPVFVVGAWDALVADWLGRGLPYPIVTLSGAQVERGMVLGWRIEWRL